MRQAAVARALVGEAHVRAGSPKRDVARGLALRAEVGAPSHGVRPLDARISLLAAKIYVTFPVVGQAEVATAIGAMAVVGRRAVEAPIMLRAGRDVRRRADGTVRYDRGQWQAPNLLVDDLRERAVDAFRGARLRARLAVVHRARRLAHPADAHAPLCTALRANAVGALAYFAMRIRAHLACVDATAVAGAVSFLPARGARCDACAGVQAAGRA